MDFRIKTISLPNGRTVEVVYLHTDETECPTTPGLFECISCSSKLLQPQSWKEIPGNRWWIRLWCPECNHIHEGQFDHDEVVMFDEALNNGTDSILNSLENISRENMANDVGLLIQAIHSDNITPFDF